MRELGRVWEREVRGEVGREGWGGGVGEAGVTWGESWGMRVVILVGIGGFAFGGRRRGVKAERGGAKATRIKLGKTHWLRWGW